MNREDFPMLANNNIIYFDNGATTLKPKCVVDAIEKYYKEHTSNIHRGEYDAAIKTNALYDNTRELVKDFINCNSKNEVIFTMGATASLNMVVFGFMKQHLQKDDEVLLTKSEHASNILPWLVLQEEMGIKVKFIPLDENHCLTIENLKKCLTNKTKVISIAHVTNVIGDERPIKEIGQICKEKNIYFNVDGAQSVPHRKVDFKEANIDFLSFSAHKMLGPTGVGCLVIKEELLEELKPLMYGGGMNIFFEEDGSYQLKEGPSRFEAGTPPIAQVIGLGEAIKYLNSIGMDNVEKHEKELKEYLLKGLEKIDGITVYNKTTTSGIVAFNIDGVFPQETSIYLNHYNIAVRAGTHCAKMLKDEIGIKNTVRISLYIYNTKEEIDKLLDVLKNREDLYKIVL